MKKVVNGYVVEIDNIEIFELASKGIAMQKVTLNSTKDAIDKSINLSDVRRYINLYDMFFSYLPYPLYAIESNIKYSALATFIKAASNRNIKMWINDGLNIVLNSTTCNVLKIVGNSWSLEHSDEFSMDNTYIELYKNMPGYKEYKWVLSMVSKNIPTSNFYRVFMPEFVRACNNDFNTVRHELRNILTFSNIPEKTELKVDRIIDADSCTEYYMDIYCSGEVDSGDKTQCWDFTGAGDISHTRNECIKTYEFKGYTKKIIGDNEDESLPKQCNIPGLRTIFMVLCEAKEALKYDIFPSYEGIVSGNHLVFTINKGIFLTKINRMMMPKGIARGVELYSVCNNKIYYIQRQFVENGVCKSTMYAYNMLDDKTSVCKISYK